MVEWGENSFVGGSVTTLVGPPRRYYKPDACYLVSLISLIWQLGLQCMHSEYSTHESIQIHEVLWRVKIALVFLCLIHNKYQLGIH